MKMNLGSNKVVFGFTVGSASSTPKVGSLPFGVLIIQLYLYFSAYSMSQSQATSKPLVEISVDSHPNANAPPIANEDANQANAPAPDSTTAAASEKISETPPGNYLAYDVTKANYDGRGIFE
ncbi:hypothetical protein QJS10_CPB18g01238 [Acorus calamus]|uniref:Uncharacterized protein n=1 Tax=Acorus calamus TaxID=4465 RepID=A0AAV9CR76_ACOCL|nr:hypothetical protein QJS10_CPB18g01238 [Acorus calamus]